MFRKGRAGKGAIKVIKAHQGPQAAMKGRKKLVSDTEMRSFKTSKCFSISCLGFPISKMKGLGCVKGKLCIYINSSLENIETVLFHYN